MWIMCAPMSLLFSVVGVIKAVYWIRSGDHATGPSMEFMLEAMITYFWAEMIWYGTLYFHETALVDLWIHHILYIIMLSPLKQYGYSSLCAPFLLLEIPTCVRAIGTLAPAFRSDVLFNATFIVFRVVWPFVPTLLIPAPTPYFYIIPTLMQTGHFYWLYLLVTRPPQKSSE